MSSGLPENVSSPSVGESYHNAARSKTAKYVSYSVATQEAMWLRSFLQDLDLTLKLDHPIEMLCDNIVAIQFTKDLKFHKKTKQIKRCYHIVRDAKKIKDIVIKYISTNKMIIIR